MPPKKTEENDAQINAGEGVGTDGAGNAASAGNSEGAAGAEQAGAEQSGSSEPDTAAASDVATAQAPTESAAPLPDEALGSETLAAWGNESVEVRVLQACEFGVPNDVVRLFPVEAAAAQKHGLVDADPVAVAYAKSLH